MDEFKRALENGTVLFVMILSAPIAALLAAVFLIYLYMIFFRRCSAKPLNCVTFSP